MLKLGDNTILIKGIEDESANMILADFDYGFGRISKTVWKKQDLSICDDLIRVLKPGGVIVLFASGDFVFELHSRMPKYYKYTTIWDKGRVTGHLNAKKMPMLRHESIMIFAKNHQGRHTYNPQKKKGIKPHTVGKVLGEIDGRDSIYGNYKRMNTLDDMKYPQSIIHFPAIHPKFKKWPTEKPIELIEYLVKTYSNKGSVVLDPACGSGKTPVACKTLDRTCIAFDKSPAAIKMTRIQLESII